VAKGITAKGKDSLIVGELAAEIQGAAALVAEAQAAHEEAKKVALQLEKLYEKRDAAVALCVPLNQRASKALQGNLGKARLREMGDYGFTVNDSPQASKTTKKP
jgi:conjugal transfer/entry exclusion protein